MSNLPATSRTTVRRAADRGHYDRATLYAILDAAYVCHVAFQDAAGSTHCIPTVCWREGDGLLIHGSNGSRMVRALAAGAQACVTVTHLDGLVLARSAFHHSMNYRSAVAYGVFTCVPADRAAAALDGLMNHIALGRAAEVRAPDRNELAATTILRLALDEFACKVRDGGPKDDEDDLALPVWAGVLPLAMRAGAPRQDPAGIAGAGEPAHVLQWRLASLSPGAAAPVPAGGAPAATPMHANAHGQPVGPPLPQWHGARAPRREALDGAHVRLEPLDAGRHGPSLADALLREASDSDWTYLSVGPFADRQAYLAYLQGAAASRDTLHFAVIERASGEAVGTIAFMRIDQANGSIEIGHVTFSSRMQRSPAATEAVHLMISEAFDMLGNRRLEWKCDAFNARSCRAAERFGFRFEGLFRQAVVYKARSRDTAWFALTDVDWPKVRARQRAWLAATNFDAAGRQKVAMKDIDAALAEAHAPDGAA